VQANGYDAGSCCSEIFIAPEPHIKVWYFLF
jgi:hypothetical protein